MEKIKRKVKKKKLKKDGTIDKRFLNRGNKGKRKKPRKEIPDLKLSSLIEAQTSYSEIINKYYKRKMGINKAKALSSLFRGYFQYCNAVSDESLSARLDVIEEMLKVRGLKIIT